MKQIPDNKSKTSLFDLVRQGGGWQSLVSMVRALAGLAFVAITLRLLGFENTGIAWAMLGITHTANAVLSFGTITTTTQYLSSSRHSREALRKAVNECLGYILTSGAVWIILLIIAAPYLVNLITDVEFSDIEVTTMSLIVFGVYGVVFRAFLAMTSFLRARQDYRASAFSWLFYDLLTVIATTISVSISPSLFVFSLTLLTVAVASVVFASISFVRCYGSLPRPVPSVLPVTRFWKFGRWVYGNEVFASLANGMDRIVLSALFSPALLPFYLFPRKLYETVHNLFSNQASFLFTVFSSIEKDNEVNREQKQSRLFLLIWIYALLGAFSYGVLTFFADPILSLVAPDQEIDKFVPYIYLFCIIGYFQSLAVPLFHMCYAEKRPIPVLIYALVNGVGSLALLFAFSFWFGFFEACMSQMIIAVTSIGLVFREIRLSNDSKAITKLFTIVTIPSVIFCIAAVSSYQIRIYSGGDLLIEILAGIIFAILFGPVTLWIERLFFGLNSSNLVLLQRLSSATGMNKPVYRPLLRIFALV